MIIYYLDNQSLSLIGLVLTAGGEAQEAPHDADLAGSGHFPGTATPTHLQ